MEHSTAPKLYAAFDAEGNPFHIRGEGKDVTGMEALPSDMTVDQAAVLRRLPDGTWGPRLPAPEPTEEDRARDAAEDLAARRAARLQAIEDEMAPYIEDNRIGIVTALQLSKKRAVVEARHALVTD